MDRVNSHTKSYNIPRSFEAIITKLEIIRAWVTCGGSPGNDRLALAIFGHSLGFIRTKCEYEEEDAKM